MSGGIRKFNRSRRKTINYFNDFGENVEIYLPNQKHKDLVALKVSLEREVTQLKSRITDEESVEGKRIGKALSIRKLLLTSIHHELSHRKEKERADSLEVHFFKVAREKLEREVFNEILNKAKELRNIERDNYREEDE